jgi:hypothetical protein
MVTRMLVKDVYGDASRIQLKPRSIPIVDPNSLWVDYDRDTDSIIIYLTGKPVRCASVYVDDNIYALADPATGDIVGFQVDAWERSFLPRHPDLQLVWPQIKKTIAPDEGWSEQLKVYLMFTALVFSQMFNTENGNGSSVALLKPV